MHPSNLRSIVNGPFFISEIGLQTYSPFLDRILDHKEVINFKNNNLAVQFLDSEGEIENYNTDTEVEVATVIGVVHLIGPIFKYSDDCGNIGTDELAEQLTLLYNDERIAGVIIKCDSPGGASNAVEHISHVIDSRNKPVVGFVHGDCSSAAYWILSHCDAIYSAYSMNHIGSVGAFTRVLDDKKKLEKEGLTIQYVYAPQSTRKNEMSREFDDTGKTTLLEAELTKLCDHFINVIHENRGIELDSEVFTGAVYSTEAALSHNLIDGVLNFEEVIDLCATKAIENKNTNMFGGKKSKNFAALAMLIATAESERTQAMVDAVNTEFAEADFNAVLIDSTLGIKTSSALSEKLTELSAATAKIGTLEAAAETLKGELATAKTSVETVKTELAAANKTIETATAVFGEEAKAKDFNFQTHLQKVADEHKLWGEKLTPGGKLKGGADEVDEVAEYVPTAEEAKEMNSTTNL